MPFLVVPAGGRGLRMGAGRPKQFLDWGGRPLIKATIDAFFAPDMPALDGVAVALPLDRLGEAAGWAFPAPHRCCAGGETRQESVAAALSLIEGAPDDVVLIHDAVRPFPPAAPIKEALAAVLGGWDGAVLAEASTDTLKQVGEDLRVRGTLPRERIYRAQTPQAARLSTWLRAFAWAKSEGFAGTDDVSILEAMGLSVKAIPSPPSNRKITVPEDWEMLRPEKGRGFLPDV